MHSHILPNIDDGAKDVETSVELLKQMWEQGIAHVISTPHFDPSYQNIDDFKSKVALSYLKVLDAVKGLDVPEISVGSEVFYFNGIGQSSGISELTLCRSGYLLLELPNCKISADIVRNITNIRERFDIMPIIAHIERYKAEKDFKKLLTLIENGSAIAQINATSVLMSKSKRFVLKLIKQGYISFIATDTHSLNLRPPKLKEALEEIEKSLGKRYSERLITNSKRLCEEIFRLPELTDGE